MAPGAGASGMAPGASGIGSRVQSPPAHAQASPVQAAPGSEAAGAGMPARPGASLVGVGAPLKLCTPGVGSFWPEPHAQTSATNAKLRANRCASIVMRNLRGREMRLKTSDPSATRVRASRVLVLLIRAALPLPEGRKEMLRPIGEARRPAIAAPGQGNILE